MQDLLTLQVQALHSEQSSNLHHRKGTKPESTVLSQTHADLLVNTEENQVLKCVNFAAGVYMDMAENFVCLFVSSLLSV